MAGKRKYFDLRYMFMRGLQAHERMQRGKHYLKSAAECTSKAIVSLELSEKNVNTAKQAIRLESIGPETVRRLEGHVNSQVYSSERPAPGRYVSSAGALLVALLNLTEKAAADSQGGVALITEEELRTAAARLSDETFLPAHSPGFCQAWWRLEVLIKRDLVKRRSLNKASVYHLLPLGMNAALSLRARSLGHDLPSAGMTDRSPPSATSTSSSSTAVTAAKSRKRKANTENQTSGKKVSHPIPSTSTAASPPSATAATSTITGSSCLSPSATGTPPKSAELPVEHVLTDAMYSNDKGQDGVVLLVDIQECGGNRAGLAELCELIKQTGTTYRTRKLPCADYNWLWRCEGVERQLPVLLERKRADDVAFSLKDGRFWRQINKMTSKKEEFQKKGVQATLQYVIEGKPEKFVVRCVDGCQGVGRCGNPSLQQIQRVLGDLREHPHVDLVAMDSILDTVRHLAQTTKQLQDRAERGEFDALVIAELIAASQPQEAPAMDKTTAEPVLILSDDKDTNNDIIPHQNNSITWRNKSYTEESHIVNPGPVEDVKGNHSSLRVGEDYDELPPLVSPSSAKCRYRDVNTASGSVGHSVRQTCGDGPVPLTTPSGSPRGRVYLMKSKADKYTSLISPQKGSGSGHGYPSATRTNIASGKELNSHRESDNGLSMVKRDRLENALTQTEPKNGGWKLQPENMRGDSPSAFCVSSGNWDKSVKPFTDWSSSSKPATPEKSTSLLAKSPVNATPHRHYATPHRHYTSRDLDLADDTVFPVCCSVAKTFSPDRDLKDRSVLVNCSAGSDFSPGGDLKDHSVLVNSAAVSVGLNLMASAPPSPTSPSPIAVKLTASSMVDPPPGDLTSTATFQNGEKGTAWIWKSSHDGSDSDSLPDIDLSVGPLRHPSQTISSSPPPHHHPAPEKDQEGEITLWPSGSNSQEKTSGAAPRPPHNADTHVQPADKIAQIAIVFPQMTGSQIAEVLRRFDGDVERSVIGILEDPGLVGV